MNLRDKLRAVGGSGGNQSRPRTPETEKRDCQHLAVYRPLSEFPGALEVRRETVARMSRTPLPEAFDPRRILYLDTETTGLGGSGTVAFLVGLGYLTDAGFEVHQFLMRDYDEESALLRNVEAGLNRFDMVCTFNGATFDLPLLESRFLMNRFQRDCLRKPHLDLLQVARRLWRNRLGKCSLGRLEALILGQPREDDLPGSEVPQRYFDYLKTGNAYLLEDILRHNAQDIASLCVLLTHMADMYDHPEQIPYSEDVYAMGRALERMNHPEEARKCYRLARRGRMGTEAGQALAHSYRRAGEREAAARVWREMIAERRGGAGPYIELAKYLEHGRRDYAGALEMTERAIALLSEARLRQDAAVQETENALQYRRRRLKKRLASTRKKKEQKTDGTGNDVQGQ
ncbi:MAG: ribonuclease H-like domain-containing protein [Clostridia bacterium]|nr:ribonuclease H-like domain-containing protein [Clostridia bacterium]